MWSLGSWWNSLKSLCRCRKNPLKLSTLHVQDCQTHKLIRPRRNLCSVLPFDSFVFIGFIACNFSPLPLLLQQLNFPTGINKCSCYLPFKYTHGRQRENENSFLRLRNKADTPTLQAFSKKKKKKMSWQRPRENKSSPRHSWENNFSFFFEFWTCQLWCSMLIFLFYSVW